MRDPPGWLAQASPSSKEEREERNERVIFFCARHMPSLFLTGVIRCLQHFSTKRTFYGITSTEVWITFNNWGGGKSLLKVA